MNRKAILIKAKISNKTKVANKMDIFSFMCKKREICFEMIEIPFWNIIKISFNEYN